MFQPTFFILSLSLLYIATQCPPLSFVFHSPPSFFFQTLYFSILSLFRFIFTLFLHPSPFPLPSSPNPPLNPSVSRVIHLYWRDTCCFDRSGSDGEKGRKAATPWQQRHIIAGKTHPTINYWSPCRSTNTLGTSCCHCGQTQWSAISAKVLNLSRVLILSLRTSNPANFLFFILLYFIIFLNCELLLDLLDHPSC